MTSFAGNAEGGRSLRFEGRTAQIVSGRGRREDRVRTSSKLVAVVMSMSVVASIEQFAPLNHLYRAAEGKDQLIDQEKTVKKVRGLPRAAQSSSQQSVWETWRQASAVRRPALADYVKVDEHSAQYA